MRHCCVGPRRQTPLPRIANSENRTCFLRKLRGVVPTKSPPFSSSVSGIRLARGYKGARAPLLSHLLPKKRIADRRRRGQIRGTAAASPRGTRQFTTGEDAATVLWATPRCVLWNQPQ
jgi:hypothetical protein